MKKKQNKKKRDGFTLVEMVIVITILGILSSLGFMKFGQVQNKARLNSDYIAASSLVTATSLAVNDNKNIIKDGKVKIEDLVKEEYLTVAPKPQSEAGDFIITVDKNNEITINLNLEGMQLYPRVEVEAEDKDKDKDNVEVEGENQEKSEQK